MAPTDDVGAGAWMDQRFDDPLHQRLDRLEGKGRAALTAVARRAAWIDAVRIAARASLVAPLVLLLLAFVRPIDPLAAVALCVLVPVGVLVATYGLRAARIRVAREAALAWLDQAAALKDRAVMAAEFARDGRGDGFRAAALDEAQPWLDRAEAVSSAAPPAPAMGPRVWAWPLLAALLLGAALLLDPARSGGHSRDAASPLRRIAAAIGISPAGQVAPSPGGTSPAQRSAGGNAGGAAAGTVGQADAATAAAGTATGLGSDGAAADGRSAATQSAGRAGASPSAAGAANGAGDAGRGDAAASPPQASNRQQGEAPSPGQAKAGDTLAADTRATPPQGGSSTAGGAAPAAGTPPATPKTSGDDGRQQGGSRNRTASGQQSSGPGSQGNNNSGQGSNRGNGQEGVKRARGTSSLLLAVPMEDRVIGTVNAGRIAATTRIAPPRSVAAGVVAAEGRGAGAPQAGRIPHGGRTVQEDRMLERYFRRAGVDR